MDIFSELSEMLPRLCRTGSGRSFPVRTVNIRTLSSIVSRLSRNPRVESIWKVRSLGFSNKKIPKSFFGEVKTFDLMSKADDKAPMFTY